MPDPEGVGSNGSEETGMPLKMRASMQREGQLPSFIYRVPPESVPQIKGGPFYFKGFELKVHISISKIQIGNMSSNFKCFN